VERWCFAKSLNAIGGMVAELDSDFGRNLKDVRV
jgi:hypothetical protein